MLTALILLQLLIPPSCSFFFGSSSGGCPCSCHQSQPVCAPTPVCAQQSQCSSSYQQYSYSPAYSNYQTGWSPAIPGVPAASPSYSPSSYSASYPVSSSSIYYSNPIPSYSPVPTYSTGPVPPPPLPPSPLYVAPQTIPSYPADNYDKIVITTPSYLQSGYASKSYETESSLESMIAPLPPPIDGYSSADNTIAPLTYDYKTSEVVSPTNYFKSVHGEQSDTEGQLVEKQGYYPKETTTATEASKYDQLDSRHNILKRMKASAIPRTNNTCNSIKLANAMMRAIVDDVTVSKRMIQHATKLAFDGAKFDVFCANGEFSYSIHSRKYCEITKEEVTCFAFR